MICTRKNIERQVNTEKIIDIENVLKIDVASK